jgi:hypothetical protein
MNFGYLYWKKTTTRTMILFGSGLLILLFLSACSQDFGRIHWDQDVTQAFQNNQVQPYYNYYQYTIGTQVYAIVGLDRELEMSSNIWRELSSDMEDFSLATSRIWDNYTQLPEYPRGAIIRNPSGENVGVYFSSIRFVSVKFKPNNRVMVMLDNTPITGGPDDWRTP